MQEPNYKDYSESELENILDYIDHDKWPDRVQKIESILKTRELVENGKTNEALELDKSDSVAVFSPRQIFIGSYIFGL